LSTYLEPKYNKYLDESSFKTRSKKELIDFLVNMTNDILNLSRQEINKENYIEENLIVAAEERLRIKQDKLLEKKDSDLESSYIGLIENWLSIVIEFYQVLNQINQGNQSKILAEGVNKINKSIDDVLSKIDELQIEISTLCSSNKILNWLKIYLPNESYRRILGEIDGLNEDNKEGLNMLNSMIAQMKTYGISDFNMEGIEKKIENPDVSIKHKLKLTIPLFLFINYETEIELSDKQKLPKSFKELKKLFLK